MVFPLEDLYYWSPFRLDALGLVTLLGAQEVTTAVGALARSYYTEYLPLFGSYLIAENDFTHPIPGYSLYNISDGVYVPTVNGWFSRWLISYAKNQVTILEWRILDRDRSYVRKELLALTIGMLVNCGLIVLSALQGDHYGFANAIAMTTSVVVRWRMVRENRNNLDQLVENFLDPAESNPFLQDSKENLVKIVITAPDDKVIAFKIQRGLLSAIFTKLDVRQEDRTMAHVQNAPYRNSVGFDVERAGSNRSATLARVATDLASHEYTRTTSGSNPVSRFDPTWDVGGDHGRPSRVDIQPRQVAHDASSTMATEVRADSRSSTPRTVRTSETARSFYRNRSFSQRLNLYAVARSFGWAAFAVHVISIGSATLTTQIMSVAILIIATVMTIYRIGSDGTEVARRLTITEEVCGFTKHREAFLWLNPTAEEAEVMRYYSLLPYLASNGEAVSRWNSAWWRRWNEER